MNVKFPDCFEDGSAQRITYPAGELQVRISGPVAAQMEAASLIVTDAIIKNSADLVSLLLYEDAVAQIVPAARHVLRLPYLPYARADRRFVYGDCAGLGVLLEMLTRVGSFNEIQVLDVHNYAAVATNSKIINVSPVHVIRKAVDAFGNSGMDRVTVLFPDNGAAKRYGEDLGAAQYLYASKKRHPATGVFEGFEVPNSTAFECDRVLIVDDICDGGGTFTGIAEELLRRGFRGKLGLYVTHGIFSKGTGDMFSGLRRYFSRFFTTNSFQTVYENGFTTWDAFEALARADRIQERVDSRSV